MEKVEVGNKPKTKLRKKVKEESKEVKKIPKEITCMPESEENKKKFRYAHRTKIRCIACRAVTFGGFDFNVPSKNPDETDIKIYDSTLVDLIITCKACGKKYSITQTARISIVD